jgi:hypothetical protein
MELHPLENPRIIFYGWISMEKTRMILIQKRKVNKLYTLWMKWKYRLHFLHEHYFILRFYEFSWMNSHSIMMASNSTHQA